MLGSAELNRSFGPAVGWDDGVAAILGMVLIKEGSENQ